MYYNKSWHFHIYVYQYRLGLQMVVVWIEGARYLWISSETETFDGRSLIYA